MPNLPTRQKHRETLRNAGLKVTPVRVRLLELLQKSHIPLAASRLSKSLKSDKVTVYRTLESFQKKGLVKPVNLRQSEVHYEFLDPHDHHHLVCLGCGRIEDFHGCNFAQLSKTILKQSKSFKVIQQHDIEFFGLCNECANA